MLKINEIFGPTIQGEGPFVGNKCAFIRLQGCDFNCSFCDTKESIDPNDGTNMSIESIVETIENMNVPLVVITGGNPFLQSDVKQLISELCDIVYVQVETQGSIEMEIDERALVVVCPKNVTAHHLQNHTKLGFGCEVALKYLANPNNIHDIIETIEELCSDSIFDLRDIGDLMTDVIYISIETKLLDNGDVDFETLRSDYKYIVEALAASKATRFKVYPQQHVIAWGSKKGV